MVTWEDFKHALGEVGPKENETYKKILQRDRWMDRSIHIYQDITLYKR